jgi:hypothetical protein
MQHYSVQRNVEYGFPAAGAEVKFAALDGCSYLDMLEYKNEANASYCIQVDGDLRSVGLGAWFDRVELVRWLYPSSKSL